MDNKSHEDIEKEVAKEIPEEQHNVKFFTEETRDRVREVGCVIVGSAQEASEGGKIELKD